MPRKITLLGLCLTMLIILAGCGKSQTATAIKREPRARESAPILSEIQQEQNDNTDSHQMPHVKIAWAGYSENRRILDNCLNSHVISETMHLSSELHYPIFRLNSKSDIERFISEYSDILCFNEGHDEIPSFNETVATYDEDFFSEHCLMCVYVIAGSGSFRYGVKEIQNDNSTFRVSIEQINSPEVYTSDMAGWYIFIEINESVIQDCTAYDAQYLGIGTKEVNTIK